MAIIFESVVTITLSIFLQDKAYLIVETIRGLLLKFKIFLFFKPFEPDLAGIIQIIFFLLKLICIKLSINIRNHF